MGRKRSKALKIQGIYISSASHTTKGSVLRKYLMSSRWIWCCRSYFRCTHKFDQGCMAVRQVQRSEEDPSTYLITYLGEHTCRDPAMAPQLFSTSDVNNTCLLSFGASRHRAEKEAQVPASPFTSRKQESDEEGLSNLSTACSSPDYFVIPAAEKPAVMAPTSGFLADLYFEDVFGFDHDGFLS